MRRYLYIVILGVCLLSEQTALRGQTTVIRYPRMRFIETLEARNAFYAEYMPARSGISLNYDYRSADNFAVRIGVGEFFYRGESPRYYPVSFDYLFNSGAHNIQLGVGALVLDGGGAEWLLGPRRMRIGDSVAAVVPGSSSNGIFTADVGYRYEPKLGGLVGIIDLTIMGSVNIAPAAFFSVRVGYVF